LNSVVAGTFAEASVTGSTIMVRDNVSYDDVFATMSGISNGGGANGDYMSAWDACTEGLMQSGELYREVALLYGPGSTSTAAANIGVINASISGADLAAGQVLNFTKASWAPGLWPMMVSARVDVYQSDAATLRAVECVVSAPDETKCRITLTKAASSATVAAGDIVVARTSLDVSCYGLEAILANTGTLFGISASTYPQWKASTHAVGSTVLDRGIILGVTARLQSKGAKGGACLFVSGPCMADLIEEAAELHRDSASPDVIVHGAESVTYKTPIGLVEAKVHPYMKQGIAMMLPKNGVKRPGSTDLTFNNGKNEWFMKELADNAGTQLAIYSNQAIVIERPWHAAYFTGIVSTYDVAPS
jgi:hypothetical protein